MRPSITFTPRRSIFAPLVLSEDLEAAFKTAAEFGYEGLEIMLREAGQLDARELQRMIRRYGVQIAALGTGLAYVEDGLGFTHPDAAVREAAIARVRGHLELGGILGAPVILGLIRGQCGHDAGRADRVDWQLSATAACARVARELDSTLLVEPINRYEMDNMNRVEECLAFVNRLGEDNVRLLVDTFHMNIEEVDISASLREAASVLGHVHLADSNRWAPGFGHTDLAAVLRTLRQVGYAGFLSLEVLPRPTALEAAAQGRKFFEEARAHGLM